MRWFRSLFSGVGRSNWPSDIPRLYPGASDGEISGFLTEEQYRAALKFPIVTICPLVTKLCEPRQLRFGIGLQQLLIRNLMLIRNLSIHGSEDSPDIALETVQERFPHLRADYAVSGRVSAIGSKFKANPVVLSRMDGPRRIDIEADDFPTFLMRCSESTAAALGGHVDDAIRDAWRIGQPSRVDTLVALGDLCLSYEREDPEFSRIAAALWHSDPDFATALWHLDDDSEKRQMYLEGIERDPLNAQLCFYMFIHLWDSSGPQPYAVQYLRKAIENSPGHGKAHMCAPHAAEPFVDMMRHSELGYRLLPGNSFAVNNYIINLRRAKRPAKEILELAEEGIKTSPDDPGNYDRLIELCVELNEYRHALHAAQRLQQLFEPAPSERTLYCLRQNPVRAKLLESGQYDPAAENRRLIEALRRKLEAA